MGEATDEVRAVNDVNNIDDDSTVERLPQTTPRHTVQDATEGGAEAAQIRSNIEQTRGDLSETIDALQEKLDPARIAEQVKDQIREKASEALDTAKNTVKEATIGKAEKIMANVSETVSDVTGRASAAVKDTGSSVMQYASEHPVPLILIGVGVGILAFNSRRKSQPSYRPQRSTAPDWYGDNRDYEGADTSSSLTDRARDVATGVAGKARETAGRATAALSSAADTVRDTASGVVDTTKQQLNYVSDQARHGADVATDRFQTTLQENPLALGVAALAAGAIVGLSLPSTRIEGEYMGKARDQLVDRAKSVAQETAQKVQRVTEEAGRTLKDAAQKEGLAVGDTGASSSS